jgi:hypothetical protein
MRKPVKNNKNTRTVVLGTRFVESHAKLVRAVAEKRGEDTASFLRRATLRELARLSYLSRDEKKALGMFDDLLR